MELNDVQTKVFKKQEHGSFIGVVEREWLEYVGYSKEELEKADEVVLVFKAETSERKKMPFIGFGRPEGERKKKE